jgi:iron complex outermembrane receptor protein
MIIGKNFWPAVTKHLQATAVVLMLSSSLAFAQTTTTLGGSITDATGGAIPKATVTATSNGSGKAFTTTTDAAGHFTVAVPAGTYTLEVTAPGFAIAAKQATVATDGSAAITVVLSVNAASDSVEVEANAVGSVAAALAPMDALLGETSAHTEITSAFINNFENPIADYGEIVQMAPATFTLSSDGVGLGQSKTYFRGFPDGDYDIKFDGIPWTDTNSVSHHSWSFFPAQTIGGVDFDRSPGTASTVGFAPFGGSINLLSKDVSPVQNLRASVSAGSFDTYLYDLQYDSGPFGPGKKLNLTSDVHHMQSHGFQTWNNQNQNAGGLKIEWRLSPKTILTGYSGVVWLDSNTPNFSATRCQMYGNSPTGAYAACPTGAGFFTGAGINFLNTNNSDPNLYTDAKYNTYHVPTDFEYVGLHKELPKGFTVDIKPYTYSYNNSEFYSNATTITELPKSSFTGGTYLGLPVAPCNVQVVKSGVSALPCAVDKYNSYRQYGEASQISQVSKFGILRTGLFYNWSTTDRHQYPTDPLTGWTDQPLPNFKEQYKENTYQPFVEYEFHITNKFSVTPGVKFSYFNINTKQYADNGKTIGGLGTNNPASFITNGGSYFATLPSGVANYRIRSNWSVFAQTAKGTIMPPSNVFDFTQGPNGTPVETLPKQQKNTTYEAGTVFKLKNLTFDFDYFHVFFENSYSSVTDTTTGEPVYYLQPSSITQGIEGESNLYFGHGLSLYLNASYDKGSYKGTLTATCAPGTGSGATACTSSTPTYVESAPSGLNIAQTPSDVETEGLTYQKGSWDLGFFNKRVGTYYLDSGAYHNAFTITPFTLENLFFNYTIRNGGRFNNTKLRFGINNLWNVNNITGVSLNNKAVASTFIAPSGVTYTDQFNIKAQVLPSGADTVSILSGRAFSLQLTFGNSAKR